MILRTVKNIWINEHHDTDWDGVPNFRDCNIFNPHEHGIISDVKKSVKKRKIQSFEKKYGKVLKKGSLTFEIPKPEIIDSQRRRKFEEEIIAWKDAGMPGKPVKKYCPKCDITFFGDKCTKCGRMGYSTQHKIKFSAYQIPGVDEVVDR